jgi:hypothetical protein
MSTLQQREEDEEGKRSPSLFPAGSYQTLPFWQQAFACCQKPLVYGVKVKFCG